MKHVIYSFCAFLAVLFIACQGNPSAPTSHDGTGLRIVYVNGDSIVQNYKEFKDASDRIEKKQRQAESGLKEKMNELDRQIGAYQKRAQSGAMSPKDMQQEEQRLGGMQQALQAESEQLSQELMTEMQDVNSRLQKIIKDKLKEIQAKEGYDYILNSMEGGAVLIAAEAHDITGRVLQELNGEEFPVEADSSDAE